MRKKKRGKHLVPNTSSECSSFTSSGCYFGHSCSQTSNTRLPGGGGTLDGHRGLVCSENQLAAFTL